MILSDNLDNTEFVYLYVDKFKWTNHSDAEAFSGHPKPKSAYRCIYNKDTKGYRLIYSVDNGDGKAMIIDTIDNNDPQHGFICKMRVITKENVLSCDISDEDLDKMVYWTDIDNEDLKKIIKPTDNTPMIKITNSVDNFMETVVQLQDSNPLLVDSIHEFMFSVLTEEPETTTVDTTWLNLSFEFGTGANISKALEHIATYAGENRRTNLDEKDLFLAIKWLLNEYTNRNFNR